jgi:hypothetical protein
MAKWIMSFLNRFGEVDDSFDSLMRAMRTEIEAELKTLRLIEYPLTILVTGFLHRSNQTEPICLKISNVNVAGEVGTKFEIKTLTNSSDCVVVEFEGMVGAVPSEAMQALQTIAASKIDRRHALRKAVLILQKSAKSVKSLRTIGEHCNSAVIEAAINTTIVATYHVPRADRLVFGPNSFVTKGIYSYGVTVQGEELLTGPEIRKRDPCWCGGGMRFKDCHMKKFGSSYVRVPSFKRPMTFVTSISFDNARPSGSTFCIAGGFE